MGRSLLAGEIGSHGGRSPGAVFRQVHRLLHFGARDDAQCAAPGAVRLRARRARRRRPSSAGQPAWPDGAEGLPERAARRSRCRGRLPGRLPRPGQPGRVHPPRRLDRELAVRSRTSRGDAIEARHRAGRGSTRSPRSNLPFATTRCGANPIGRCSTRRSTACPNASHSYHPLLLAGTDLRRRLPCPRTVGDGGPRPTGAGPRAVASAADPTRRDGPGRSRDRRSDRSRGGGCPSAFDPFHDTHGAGFRDR